MTDGYTLVLGESGHRNIPHEDRARTKETVCEIIWKLKEQCGQKGARIAMINAFAQGGDMICAEAAFEAGVDVFALLPCEREKYLKSFSEEEDREKLLPYLERVKGVRIAPDVEKRGAWFLARGMDKESYEYRQLGIYMAQRSDLLFALWDGKPPKSEYGCGTAEVVEFALEGKYFGFEKTGERKAVCWVKSRRQGDGSKFELSASYLTSIEEGENAEGERLFGKYRSLSTVPAFLHDLSQRSLADFKKQE